MYSSLWRRQACTVLSLSNENEKCSGAPACLLCAVMTCCRPTVAQDLSTTPSSSQPSSPRPPYALLAIPDWVGPQRTPALGSVAPDVDALAPNASLAFRAAAAALSYRTQARYRGFNVTALVRRRVSEKSYVTALCSLQKQAVKIAWRAFPRVLGM